MDAGDPQAARARTAEITTSGTWSSALSAQEFAAIRSVGFEPVGQVMGAVVHKVGYEGSVSCSLSGLRRSTHTGPRARTRSVQAFTEVSGSGLSAAYGFLVHAQYEARRKAISRMSSECQALGGHGVVGVTLTIGPFPGGGLEFRAIGTAVRAPGGLRLHAPFTSVLSGQEFAKLIMAGNVPISLVLGISIGLRHDDWLTARQSRWTAGNVEVPGYTELVNRTRQDARNELMLDVSRVCADGVVIQRTELRISERECPRLRGARDHRADVTMIGTAIARFAGERQEAARSSIAVLSLDPQRRRTARSGAGNIGQGDGLSAPQEPRHDIQEVTHNGAEEQQ